MAYKRNNYTEEKRMEKFYNLILENIKIKPSNIMKLISFMDKDIQGTAVDILVGLDEKIELKHFDYIGRGKVSPQKIMSAKFNLLNMRVHYTYMSAETIYVSHPFEKKEDVNELRIKFFACKSRSEAQNLKSAFSGEYETRMAYDEWYESSDDIRFDNWQELKNYTSKEDFFKEKNYAMVP